jgi:hypothetical protein
VPADVVERAALPRGDRVLASAATDDGSWLLGTRDALVVVEPAETVVIPWERVETADWDSDADRLRVVQVADFGQVRPAHVFGVPEPGSLLAMVRERVTASVLLQRRVPLVGRQGMRVVARRPPRGQGDITWSVELGAGLDPDDPDVREAAAAGLGRVQDELGPGAGRT